MKRFLISSAIVATLAAGAVYAYGPFGNGMDGSPFGGCKSEKKMGKQGGMKMLSDLDLSSEQRKSIRKIMFDHRETMMDFRDRNHPMALTLDKSGKLDKEAFIKQSTKNHDDMVEKKAELFEKILNVLNAEQRKAFADKLKG